MKVELKIDGMKCRICEAKVNKIIRDTIPNAKKIKSSSKKNLSSFIVDSDSQINKAVENISLEGYKVLEVIKK